jgi:hypothetical protein
MLLKQSHVAPRWKSSQQGLFGRNHELADSYEISSSQIKMDLFYYTYHRQDFYRTW